mmetsp:Transcript_12894/g.27191  ORF Transcript_12894/g.27191 Transcript_12894/m.27191 type:complete len:215 (-) Transcript_12894:1811-2455(-)
MAVPGRSRKERHRTPSKHQHNDGRQRFRQNNGIAKETHDDPRKPRKRQAGQEDSLVELLWSIGWRQRHSGVGGVRKSQEIGAAGTKNSLRRQEVPCQGTADEEPVQPRSGRHFDLPSGYSDANDLVDERNARPDGYGNTGEGHYPCVGKTLAGQVPEGNASEGICRRQSRCKCKRWRGQRGNQRRQDTQGNHHGGLRTTNRHCLVGSDRSHARQ